jgi:trans-aconitate 2-methyltransferase
MNVLSQKSIATSAFLFTWLGQSILLGGDFWEPEVYRQSSTMQKRWTANLLKQTQLFSCDKILDVGCGDGEITAHLALEQPKRNVIGVDISAKMIDFAKKSFPENQYKNLAFFLENAENLAFSNEFDAVVSFNTIHRITNPKTALQKMFDALKPGGSFAAVFPALGSKILSTSIATVDTSDEWKQYFKIPDRKDYFNTEEAYLTYLRDIGFEVVKVQILWEDEVFPNRQAFFNILKASYTQKDSLPPEKQDAFFNQIIDEYLKFMPLDHNGRAHFYFNRMEIIAFKPH